MGPSTMSHARDKKETLIQGPGLKYIKYLQSLCKYCNNMRTQPFDSAYEQFISWVFEYNECYTLKNVSFIYPKYSEASGKNSI